MDKFCLLEGLVIFYVDKYFEWEVLAKGSLIEGFEKFFCLDCAS